MKRTKLISFISIAAMALVSSTAGLSQGVSAATVNDTKNGGNSTATASLIKPDEGSEAANIKLTAVPDITFAEQVISGETLTIDSAKTVSDPITVVNPGQDDGWSVSVKTAGFVGTSDDMKGKLLRGAVLSFDAGTVSTDNPAAVTDEEKPTGVAIPVNETDGLITSASTNQGYGTWYHKHEVNEVHLSIPSANVAGDYQADLVWTLGNAPK